MENNSKGYSRYSTGYDPKAVEHDLQIISQLTRSTISGKKKLTAQQAQEIYYKIKKENIQFQSDTGEDFLLSLHESMTDAQIQEINRAVRRKKQRKRNRKQLLRINTRIAGVVSVVVLIASIVCMNWSLLMDFRTKFQTEKLRETVTNVPGKSGQMSMNQLSVNRIEHTEIDNQKTTSIENQSGCGILSKFALLHEENPDFAGWLRIPGTKIDYPVMMREGDNNYYVDRNFKQQYDKNGSLILDYRNDIKNEIGRSQQNLIIYGHNMKTGAMFGTLRNYKEKSYCDEHMTIIFDTLYEECEYKVVAALFSVVAYEDEEVFRYYDAIDISTEENFNAFRDYVMDNAIYTTEETITYGDTCLLLSTCDDYTEDGRFVVIARKCED